MPRKFKQMCASLVHHELLLESLQQEKSSLALSGAQPHQCLNHDWTTKFIFCPLEQNLIGAKMPWSEGAQSRTKLLQCKFGQIPVWKREALAVVSRVNSFQASKPCLVGWLVYHVFEDNSCMICSGSCSCLDMHLIISFSCTIFWIRRFEVHLSERSRASPAPHRNFRIHSKKPARSTSAPPHHASLPSLPSPKVRWPVAASLEQLAPPTHQCHEFRKPKLWTEHNGIIALCVFHITFCAAWCFNLVLRSLFNV